MVPVSRLREALARLFVLLRAGEGRSDKMRELKVS